MKKAIRMQTQNVGFSNISNIKEFAWFSATFDNIKLTIDAYDGPSGPPRTDCFMQIADEKEVYELTPEKLMEIIRFYADSFKDSKDIVRYRNRYHYIEKDALKQP